MRSPRAWSYVTYLASLFALGACPVSPAATETDSDSTTAGSQAQTTGTTENCPVGDLGCPCTQGGACNDGLECSPSQTCVTRGDDTTTENGPDGTSTTTVEPATTTSETSSTTGPATPCDPGGEQPSDDCKGISADKPYCSEGGVCGDCSVLPADGCAAIDPSKPLCNADDGQCVACTIDDQSLCSGATPACNPATNACEGCFEHSHCPDTACDVLKRECFPIDKVLYIRHGIEAKGDCTNNMKQGGYEQAPFCNANVALERAQSEGATSGWTFKFLESEEFSSYHGDITIPSVDVNEPVSYAFVHVGEFAQEDLSAQRHTRWQSNGAVMTVGANVVAYVNNFAIYSVSNQDDNAVGIGCLQNSSVFIDDSYIRDTRGSGIRSFGCDVYMRRSSIFKSRTEGIELNCADQACELHMSNSYITESQHVQGDGGGGIVADNATLDISFSGILANNAEVDPMDMTARGDSIHCVNDNVDGVIRNSAIGRKQMGNVLSVKCSAMLSITNSLIDSDEFKIGNNKKAGEDILGYFLANGVTGARPLNPQPPMGLPKDLEFAVWKKGDPVVDYDGQPRPAKVNQKDFVGADIMGQ
ncbi:right-handed parallel beta-helix repeat-containing protein [Nannocystis bainbridge]|uniref:Right-handed parallel beta-helix repeat-containing protein n=1 Tax=Nannocystis bainbridge TaxID=2995303 RepID=A0ABT5E0S2_9BACT|nr:right-handed parallel beta-helix repeat-containing protein [Nannocystis bainbridge]MDC0719486.1 right-handed parallel beta-helix repeat-containing protein [Nannocystis bainbridge]